LEALKQEGLKKNAESYPRYTSKHFKDQEIAHIRFDDRALPDGGKALFVLEAQADGHQDARFWGGYGPIGYENAKAAFEDPVTSVKLREKAGKFMKDYGPKGVPDMPFKGDLWLELALKRALRYAVEHGYDAISWARSDQIAKAVGAEPESLKLQY